MAERNGARAVLAHARGAVGRIGGACRQFLVGAAGTDAYQNYVGHLRRHHPEATPVSREAFAANELSARWNGVRRCC